MTNWISCKERLPEDDDEVLVFIHRPHHSYVTCSSYRCELGWVGGRDPHVTHWMPLPTPPEEK